MTRPLLVEQIKQHEDLRSPHVQGSFYRPFSKEASDHRSVGDARKDGRLVERHRPSAVIDAFRRAFVVGLDSWRGPAAIVRRVRPVRIDAIYRVALWARPHVGKKTREIVKPFRAHSDASSAVRRIPCRVGIIATLLGSQPRFVFSRLSALTSVSVREMAEPSAASTTQGVAARQGVTNDSGFAPAVASTGPKGSYSFAVHSVQCDKFAEALPCQVLPFHIASVLQS